MTELKNTIMRFVLVLMLFQFIAPAFISVISQGADAEKETTNYHAEHSSIIIPLFLKEKEETEESRADDSHFDLIPLIDFKDHSFVLTELHETKFTPFIYRDRYDFQPPLFTLHGAFII
jgi:hypothetical protein